MKYLIFILLLGCSKPYHCYQCESKIMKSWTVLNCSEEEIEIMISERIRVLNDTMNCVEINCE